MDVLQSIQYVKNPIFFRIDAADLRDSFCELYLPDIKFARLEIKTLNTRMPIYLSDGFNFNKINKKKQIWFNVSKGAFVCLRESLSIEADAFDTPDIKIEIKIYEYI